MRVRPNSSANLSLESPIPPTQHCLNSMAGQLGFQLPCPSFNVVLDDVVIWASFQAWMVPLPVLWRSFSWEIGIRWSGAVSFLSLWSFLLFWFLDHLGCTRKHIPQVDWPDADDIWVCLSLIVGRKKNTWQLSMQALWVRSLIELAQIRDAQNLPENFHLSYKHLFDFPWKLSDVSPWQEPCNLLQISLFFFKMSVPTLPSVVYSE